MIATHNSSTVLEFIFGNFHRSILISYLNWSQLRFSHHVENVLMHEHWTPAQIDGNIHKLYCERCLLFIVIWMIKFKNCLHNSILRSHVLCSVFRVCCCLDFIDCIGFDSFDVADNRVAVVIAIANALHISIHLYMKLWLFIQQSYYWLKWIVYEKRNPQTVYSVTFVSNEWIWLVAF